MRASFIIPVKSINEYVHETVSHLLSMHVEDWEAFVVTNDKEESGWNDDRIFVLASGRVGPGDKRDLAAQHATGEVLVFLDDDSFPAPDYLIRLRECLAEGHVVIGGPALTPPSDSFWQQVSGAMYLSRLTGGAPERYAPRGEPRTVEDWPSVNLAIVRQVFLDIGGFDCPFWPGEDTFLCDRLTRAGIGIWYCPELIVWHHRRPTLLSHLRQVGNYGLHRGFFAKKFRQSSLRLPYFAPSALLLVTIGVVVIPIGSLRIPLLCFLATYLVTQLVGALRIAKVTGLGTGAAVVIYAPISHLWYGTRFLQGFLLKRDLRSQLR